MTSAKFHLLIVTPAHNEESNIAQLHESLAMQSFRSFDWVLVDDGSTDDTRAIADGLTTSPIPRVLSRTNDGGLIGGSAYTSWRFGIANTEGLGLTYSHVMKLDADVRLDSDYLRLITDAWDESLGIIGGVIDDPEHREQIHHVPGPVKIYSAEAYAALSGLPSAIGFDVMDEIAADRAGLRTLVVPGARFTLARAIGASEGLVHGRYRNGRVCRWTGYNTVYFLLHAIRYLVRKPYVVGSLAMLAGYARAGSGPYEVDLKHRHRLVQLSKLRSALRNPVGWLIATYRY